MKLYLQNIVENFNQNNIPTDWLGIDFVNFSKEKKLFDYQQKAIENALKALYLYFKECEANKDKFFSYYKDNGLNEDNELIEDLSYSFENESKTIKYLLEYDKDYPIKDNKISFEYFINRMSFWMATGSGKSIVIIKLLELLGYLIQNNMLPEKDILFLTYREDLIEQFKKHVEDFNSVYNKIQINLISLKDYTSNKYFPVFRFDNVINVYFYRSDLISDVQKEKTINYRNYDNNGNWYIILDEAHKGDREESKRQMFYTILSRNGFMFNFSATFTDKRDYVTCVYNFNLSRFIENGYGKHIYISKENIKALEKKNDLMDYEKQKVLLKVFILQSALNVLFNNVLKVSNNLYHKPLLLTLVNSVNTKDSNLELFFREIEKIALGEVDNEIFERAKEEISNEISSSETKFEFENLNFEKKIIDFIKSISFKEIIKYVFNSEKTAPIEVLKIPSNKQEIIFKLKTSERPFALIKIGDITNWIKNTLKGYEINEKFEDESIFKNINSNQDINILMGSRSFYEGWDSNRPNIILFINIGKDADAKKFLLQSIGRGVRIEPIKNKRRRAQYLYNNKELDENIFKSIKEFIEPLETLFIFGTKADNLKEVVQTLKQQKQENKLGDLFEINTLVKDKLLLIPTYKVSDKFIFEEKDVIKYYINDTDFDNVKNYFNYIGDKIALCKFDVDVKLISSLKKGFNDNKDYFFKKSNEQLKVKNVEFLLQNIFKHFSNKVRDFNSFKQLEEEIIHFKKISTTNISEEKLKLLQEKIDEVKKAKDKEKYEKELDDQFDSGKISKDDYEAKIKEIQNLVKEKEFDYDANEKIKLKYVANHYYLPVVLSDSEKSDFIVHIIKHKSEVDFINELEEYLKKENNFFEKFDWWFFSKIDETLDEVYIPYYNPTTNRMDKFKPDFIFWLCKENNYTVLFVDPKGTEHTTGYRKIDGYLRIFKNELETEYDNRKFIVKTKLLLKAKDLAKVPDNYKEYWFENLENLVLN